MKYHPDWRKYDPKNGLPPPAEAKGKPRVRNAVPTEIDGHLFPSKREAERYVALKLEEQAGGITDLRLQFAFPLEVHDLHIGYYRADFTYTREGHLVVEDVKGFRTEMYRWKRRHFEAQYGIEIQEV